MRTATIIHKIFETSSGRILRDRLWTFYVYFNRVEQWVNNIVMIGKHWSNQYCYSRFILENYIKITKIKIMRWEADKRWLYEWCNDYRTIEYEVVINEKSGVIEIKTKLASMTLVLRWFSHKTADFATFTLEVCRLIRYEEKWETADFATFTLEVCRLIRYEEKWEKIEKKAYL